jgi:hypothetical protein
MLHKNLNIMCSGNEIYKNIYPNPKVKQLSVFNVMSETMKARKSCLEYLLCAFRLGNQGHRVELYRTEKRNKKNNSHV